MSNSGCRDKERVGGGSSPRGWAKHPSSPLASQDACAPTPQRTEEAAENQAVGESAEEPGAQESEAGSEQNLVVQALLHLLQRNLK